MLDVFESSAEEHTEILHMLLADYDSRYTIEVLAKRPNDSIQNGRSISKQKITIQLHSIFAHVGFLSNTSTLRVLHEPI